MSSSRTKHFFSKPEAAWRNASILLALCLLACGAKAQANSGAGDDVYTARFSDDLRTVEAKICFAGSAPDRLYRHSQAAQHASPLHHRGKAIRAWGERSLRLPPLPDNACLNWTYDLGSAADEGGDRSAMRVGESILSLTTLWFWKGPWERPLVARVELPEGFAFSTPWSPDPQQPGQYRPERTPIGWYTRSAVGRFHQETIGLPGSRVELALLGDLEPSEISKLSSWIRTTLDAVVPVFGYFPKDHTQVVVVPIGPRNEAVPWAHVVRGGGPAVQFYVDETRALEEFNADWTATHEFSHLLLPYVTRADRWLSEGLASYYQNVLRARDGRLSQRDAWQKLADGFGRGQRAMQDETLREATLGGWENVMRIYWSGAAMMLEADMDLRAISGGKQSLDSALRQLNQCCLEEGKMWGGRELLDKLDELSNTRVFSAVYDRHVESTAFPDVENSFKTLGLSEVNGRIQLNDEAPLHGIRDGIMRAAPVQTPQHAAPDNAP